MGGISKGIQSILGGHNDYSAASAPIVSPFDISRLNSSYDKTDEALKATADQQKDLIAAGGIQNQSDVYNQFQGIVNGTGPNPAQAMLAEATGNNIANQAALMAGQRGAQVNPALIARLAAQQGAANQQSLAGQSANLQANQSLNALSQAGNIAGQQVSNQLQGQNIYANQALNNQGQLLGAQGQYNSAVLGNTQMQNQINSGVASQNQAGINQISGQLIGSGATALIGKSSGGPVTSAPDVGDVGGFGGNTGGMFTSKNGKMVPALLSPGEKLINPREANEVAQGKVSIDEVGKIIPGKAKVFGDDPKNDTVNKNVESGSIVIPRSIMQSNDPLKAGTKFLIEALKKHAGASEYKDFHNAIRIEIDNRKKRKKA